ncbi:MAG: hypothetical protein JSV04_10660, partial [Candidatus Heimdallarchaeota archaeon]
TKIPFEITFYDGSKTTIWIWSNNSDIVTFEQNFEKKPRTIDADRASGYFYTLDFYTMEYIDITSILTTTTSSVTSTTSTTTSKDTTTTTGQASGITFLSVCLLIAVFVINEKRKSS